jgi:DNA modification methylase
MEGDIVLDLFGGSGSTLMASHSIKRVCYTMELDERYCDVIRKRYATALGKAETWQEETPRVL